jgi:hypothetical protein
MVDGIADYQLVDRTVSRDGNDFNRNAPQCCGETAAGVAGDVDFTRHQAAYADDATHH